MDSSKNFNAGPSPLKRLLRELALIALALLLAGLASTLVAWVATGFVESPQRAARIGRKPLTIFFLLIWLWICRPKRTELPDVLGWRPSKAAVARIARGLLLGTSTLVALNLILLQVGARVVELELAPLALTTKVGLYLLQALALGLIEESLFRGLLHQRLKSASSEWIAVVLGSILFAAAHFLRPSKGAAPVDWWDTMPACFAGLGDIFQDRWREAIGLLLVGLVLATLRSRTGTIYLSLGVHAGWVWVRFSSTKILDEVKEVVRPLLELYGSKRLYDGAMGWGALLLTLFIALIWLKRGTPHSNGSGELRT